MKMYKFMSLAMVASVSSLLAFTNSQNSTEGYDTNYKSFGGTTTQNQFQNRSITMDDAHNQTNMNHAAPEGGNALNMAAKTMTPEDTAIANDVRSALRADTSLSPQVRNIRVVADSGKVTIAGEVASDSEKLKVEAIAKGVNGVTSVSNNLTVKPQ